MSLPAQNVESLIATLQKRIPSAQAATALLAQAVATHKRKLDKMLQEGIPMQLGTKPFEKTAEIVHFLGQGVHEFDVILKGMAQGMDSLADVNEQRAHLFKSVATKLHPTLQKAGDALVNLSKKLEKSSESLTNAQYKSCVQTFATTFDSIGQVVIGMNNFYLESTKIDSTMASVLKKFTTLCKQLMETIHSALKSIEGFCSGIHKRCQEQVHKIKDKTQVKTESNATTGLDKEATSVRTDAHHVITSLGDLRKPPRPRN